MTVSGQTTFNLTVSEVIDSAYELLRIGVDGESLTAEQAEKGRRWLNMLIKWWQIDGLRLWCKTEGVLFLVEGQKRYDISSASADRACLLSDMAETTLSADAASGASTITVTSATGIANADKIGVELDDGTVQWTTVNGSPSGTTVTLANVLTDDAASGNAVFAYTTALDAPLRIIQARRRNGETDLTMEILDRPEYYEQASKDSQSTPLQLYADRQLGVMYVNLWPAPGDETETVRFTFERHMDDAATLANTLDMPAEWLLTLTHNLAAVLAPTTSFPMDERTQLIRLALSMKEKSDGFDREYGSVSFQPNLGA